MNRNFLRKAVLFLADTALVNLSFFLAFIIRFDQTPEFPKVMRIYPQLIVPMTMIRLCVFRFWGLYEWSFRYASLSEAIHLLGAVASGSLFTVAAIAFLFFHHFRADIGRSVLLIDFLLCLFLMTASRFSFRALGKVHQHFQRSAKQRKTNRVLILGAGDFGELLVREFLKDSEYRHHPVGFLDDNAGKLGVRIHGVQVLGMIYQLAHIAKNKNVQEVIIALSKITPETLKEIAGICHNLHLELRILPQTSFFISPQILPMKLRGVDASDLLGRDILQVDIPGIRQFFRDKKILITGAGGSIGSEIAKTLAHTQPRELVLLDISENNLYEIQNYFQENPVEAAVSYYLADVKNPQEIERIFASHRPDIVYHGAAYKHVPLGEQFYKEGILNNILGTKVAADLALEYGVQTFILISTDKAIRPRSIMGAGKRIAELYIQSLKGQGTRFLSVRFGNVLSSRGSVVPLFKRQLQEGSPITVTHPDVKRYFMDLSEAVFLILEATRLGSDFETFVLDMGKPIKIVDLAYSLAQLMGIPQDQVTVKYVGLRPGEKLEEELELDSETAIPTQHSKIKIWRSTHQPSAKDLWKGMEDLLQLVQEDAPRSEILQKLKDIVPEYCAASPNPNITSALNV